MKKLYYILAVSFVCLVNCDKKISGPNNNNDPNFLKINIGNTITMTTGTKGYVFLYTDENCSAIKETKTFSGQSSLLFQNISDTAVSFTVLVIDSQSPFMGKQYLLESFIKAPKGEWYFYSYADDMLYKEFRFQYTYPATDVFDTYGMSTMNSSLLGIGVIDPVQFEFELNYYANNTIVPLYGYIKNRVSKNGYYFYTMQNINSLAPNNINTIELKDTITRFTVTVNKPMSYASFVIYHKGTFIYTLFIDDYSFPASTTIKLSSPPYTIGPDERYMLMVSSEEESNSLMYGQFFKTLPATITIPDLGQISAHYDKDKIMFYDISAPNKFDSYQATLDFFNFKKGFASWYLYSSPDVTKITCPALPPEIESAINIIVNDDSTDAFIDISAFEISSVNSFNEFISNTYQQNPILNPILIFDGYYYATLVSFSGHGMAADKATLHKTRHPGKSLRNPVSRFLPGFKYETVNGR
jgi:hypothetical protein